MAEMDAAGAVRPLAEELGVVLLVDGVAPGRVLGGLAALPGLLDLRNIKFELVEEIKKLKQEAVAKDQTMWELKEYNENLEAQIDELKALVAKLKGSNTTAVTGAIDVTSESSSSHQAMRGK